MVIPKITYYEAEVWWNRKEAASTGTELQHIQRAVCIMFTGATRTTPTNVMEMILDLSTLSTVVEVAALTAVFCQSKPEEKALATKNDTI